MNTTEETTRVPIYQASNSTALLSAEQKIDEIVDMYFEKTGNWAASSGLSEELKNVVKRYYNIGT